MLVDRRQVFDSHAEHRRIVEAILAGDAAAAEEAMRAHVDGSRKLVQQLPDSHFAG
jgi:DNA-binding GntR family transcriptional regulator